MHYTLLLHYPELSPDALDPEAIRAGMTAFQRYAEALDEAGVLVSAEIFQPSEHSIRITRREGAIRMQGSGPQLEETLAGSFVIEVPDPEAASSWAAECPAAGWGTIEIRPSALRFSGGSWERA